MQNTASYRYSSAPRLSTLGSTLGTTHSITEYHPGTPCAAHTRFHTFSNTFRTTHNSLCLNTPVPVFRAYLFVLGLRDRCTGVYVSLLAIVVPLLDIQYGVQVVEPTIGVDLGQVKQN